MYILIFTMISFQLLAADKGFIQIQHDPFNKTFDYKKFKTFLDYVWENKGHHKTDAVVILKDGQLIYEGYDRGYNENKKHMYWSLSKSLTSIIIGAAIKDKILSLDDYAYKYYPSLNRKWAKDIKLRHILNMSSGFDFYEEHPIHDVFSDSVSINYSRYTFFDVAKAVAHLKMKFRPGTQFKYGTHEPILAMGILKRAINDQDKYDNYPWTALFNKLSIKNMTFEQDLSGTFIGGAFAWGTAKDYAKIGQLILNDGLWNGERIISSDYIKFATKDIAPALLREDIKEYTQQRLNIESYGAYFWLNKTLPMNKGERPYPSAPSDLIQAMGFRGQTMGIIPSEKLVIVRLGSDGRVKSKKINRNKMYGLLLKSLKTLKVQEELELKFVGHEKERQESTHKEYINGLKHKSIIDELEKENETIIDHFKKNIMEIFHESINKESVEVI